MNEPLGDMAERVAEQLMKTSVAPVIEAEAIAEEAALSDNPLIHKMRFSWRPEDRAALESIRISADAMFNEVFSEAVEVIDGFFMLLRIPEQHNGKTVLQADGRPKWRKDNGRIIEDWSQLTGTDVEQTLANLERIKLIVGPQVNQLMLEALYAKHVSQDTHDEAWTTMMDGTQGTKTAVANRESRPDRYHAYFRFYLYSVAKTFLDEVTAFAKLLDNIRYWQTRSKSWT